MSNRKNQEIQWFTSLPALKLILVRDETRPGKPGLKQSKFQPFRSPEFSLIFSEGRLN